ncbi:MAG TPA: hypothetical protein VNA68_01220 [Candidatus Dormibacteraeota bacterium]|nr:hypothetical protein [Candidatus Dormibacteraeota bacterium]
MSSKLKLLIGLLAAVLIVGAAGAAVWLNQSSKTAPKASTAVAVPSATEVVKNLQKYVGKTISLKGNIVQQQNDYFVVGLEKDSPGAIKLDFSQSKIDPLQYANVIPKDQKESDVAKQPVPKGPFTVKGRLVQDVPNSAPRLIVESISK